MWKHTVADEDLRRLKAEREEADRLYNEALTALDQALLHIPDLPAPPPGDTPGKAQLEALRTVIPSDPLAGLRGWRRRVAGFVWRLVGPIIGRQQAFNAALVADLVPDVGATRRALARTIESLAGQFAALERFHSRLIVYLQQITLYVDTKDRDEAGMLRHLLEHRAVGLAAGLSGLGDEMLKRWESMVAREQRFETRVASLAGSHNELRTALGTLHQATLVLKREMEHVLMVAEQGARPTAEVLPGVTVEGRGIAAESARRVAERLDSYKYVGFENIFRGPEAEIRARLMEYLPYFSEASDVLDIGCGRGEFLELLRAEGIGARGVDINHEMVEICRSHGLDVAEGDGIEYLEALPDGSLGGLFAAQVVEHLDPSALMRLLESARHKLRPGARIVLETINPTCWFAFFESYIKDITHVQPVHPETLRYLLQASGFQRVEIHYRAPFPEADKLQPVSVPSSPSSAPELLVLADLATTFNANVERLNRLLFTHMDYAAVGERL